MIRHLWDAIPHYFRFHPTTNLLESPFILSWYTGINGSTTNMDHVVALKDAYLSGRLNWNSSQKRTFANDTLKNGFVPLKFITKVRDSHYAFASRKYVE